MGRARCGRRKWTLIVRSSGSSRAGHFSCVNPATLKEALQRRRNCPRNSRLAGAGLVGKRKYWLTKDFYPGGDCRALPILGRGAFFCDRSDPSSNGNRLGDQLYSPAQASGWALKASRRKRGIRPRIRGRRVVRISRDLLIIFLSTGHLAVHLHGGQRDEGRPVLLQKKLLLLSSSSLAARHRRVSEKRCGDRPPPGPCSGYGNGSSSPPWLDPANSIQSGMPHHRMNRFRCGLWVWRFNPFSIAFAGWVASSSAAEHHQPVSWCC